jgi:predicted RecA/RadA family phage recombinase
VKTFYKEGNFIDYTNAGAAIAAGDVVTISALVGIAVDNIAASTGVGPVQVCGIVKVTKTGSQAWTQGQRVYWSGSVFTSVATSNTPAGVAALAVGSGSGETTGYVLLNVLPVIGATSSHVADPASAAALTQDTLTDSTGGSASTTLAAATNIDTLGGTLTGTLDNTLADVGATNSSDVSAAINKNTKEIQAELTTQRALNTVLINAVASIAAQLAKVKTDVAAVRTGSEANNTAIDSILAALEAAKINAAS